MSAKIGRGLKYAVLAPVKMVKEGMHMFAEFVAAESGDEMHRVELVNDVRRRIASGEESFDEIMADLSEIDQKICADEGINKWT